MILFITYVKQMYYSSIKAGKGEKEVYFCKVLILYIKSYNII